MWVRSGSFRHGGISPRRLSQRLQLAEEFGGCLRFLPGLTTGPALPNNAPQTDQLNLGERDVLDPELGCGDVFLFELAFGDWLVAVPGLEHACTVEHDQGGVDGVRGPTRRAGWRIACEPSSLPCRCRRS